MKCCIFKCLLINRYLKYLLKNAVSLLMLFLCYSAFGDDVQQNSKLWTSLIVGGPLTEDQTFEYYVESQARFVENRDDKFDQVAGGGGIGYRYTPNLAFWFGDSWTTTNDPIEGPNHENRIWQQVSWNAINNDSFNISTRTRLEQRKDLNEPEWAARLRQQVTLRVPIKKLKQGYFFVTYDEIFFNLNHPQWVSGQTVSQNRGFIGIAIPTSKRTSLEVGYLNQFLFGNNSDQMNHFLYLSLRIKLAEYNITSHKAPFFFKKNSYCCCRYLQQKNQIL